MTTGAVSRRLALGVFAGALAMPVAARAAAAIPIGFVGQDAGEDPPPPLSPVLALAADAGLAGARLGLADNITTGRFTGQDFSLVVQSVAAEGGDFAAPLAALQAAGVGIVVTDLPAPALLALADRPEAAGLLLINACAADDTLRNADCRTRLLHTIPSRRMLADALGQYLVARRWTRWMLLAGETPEDAAYAEAIRRAAARFGGRIVADLTWTYGDANSRADSGHETMQGLVQGATRGPEHDVLVVADEADAFGEYLPDRAFLPRPVAGTQGLVPTAWSPVLQEWGAIQLQDRFSRAAGRPMTPRDYAAWLAIRAVGEAATRTGSADPAVLGRYLRSEEFRLGAFKGQPVSFRAWDGQLRQPILLAGPRMLVSVSPQPGFLHARTELDTLGDDQPDSHCQKGPPA